MTWRTGFRARFHLFAIGFIGAGTTPAAADIVIEEANLSPSEATRTLPPTITIKFYENIDDWDATGLPAVFRLRLYAKLNVGSYLVSYVVHLPEPANDTNARLVGNFPPNNKLFPAPPRISRLDPITGSFPSDRLGSFTTAAIGVCRTQFPNGVGDALFESTMRVKLSLIAVPSLVSTKFRSFTLDRAITVSIRCQGLPAGQERKPSGPQREVKLFVKDADLEFFQYNRECPRRVAVRVTMRANMDGRVHYTLHRSDGPEQRQDMVIRWQGGNRYKGSFDHQFEVPSSRVVKLWVEHKGKRVTAERRVGIDCSKPWIPKGIYVE